MALSSLSDNLPQEILEKYNSKIVSAEAAARLINSGDHVFASGVNSGAVELLNALCERKDELTDVRITSGIIMHP
jgi:acyl-CoA hydrolase